MQPIFSNGEGRPTAPYKGKKSWAGKTRKRHERGDKAFRVGRKNHLV